MKKLGPPPVSLLDKYVGSEFQPIYETKISVAGGQAHHGRASGTARSDDGELDLDLRLPAAMGGPGGGTNPEQLFAAAYAASFHGVMNLLAIKHHLSIPESSVEVKLVFGRDPMDGRNTLRADVTARLPGVDPKLAEELIRSTERICPYAKMVRHGIENFVVVVVETQARGPSKS
jgi:lipoyl-dependent peroxiredoxin